MTLLQLVRDSESGIGIEVRDRTDDAAQTEPTILRRGRLLLVHNLEHAHANVVLFPDPTAYLPAELITHILCYLDATSLLQAELVSRTWHSAARSHYVWKHTFRGVYGKSLPPGCNKPSTTNVGGAGLGRLVPDQDWKRMFHLRKTLEANWKKGAATAIYLEGHKDSVYCVQFDE